MMRRLGCLAALLAAFVGTLYFVDYEGDPKAANAHLRARIAKIDLRAQPLVVEPHGDRFAIVVAYGFDERTREATGARIDLRSGEVITLPLRDPLDRARFDLADEVPLDSPELARRFRGLRIPRLVSRSGALTLGDPALTGREQLLRASTNAPLLTRTLVNGRDFARSDIARLRVYRARTHALLVCLYTTRFGTTVWVFR
ncbi:MAG TPA: hypothetical protein VF824_01460 [Thermoanaerobaculia bacterium]|jgi:hypothetical protein